MIKNNSLRIYTQIRGSVGSEDNNLNEKIMMRPLTTSHSSMSRNHKFCSSPNSSQEATKFELPKNKLKELLFMKNHTSIVQIITDIMNQQEDINTIKNEISIYYTQENILQTLIKISEINPIQEDSLQFLFLLYNCFNFNLQKNLSLANLQLIKFCILSKYEQFYQLKRNQKQVENIIKESYQLSLQLCKHKLQDLQADSIQLQNEQFTYAYMNLGIISPFRYAIFLEHSQRTQYAADIVTNQTQFLEGQIFSQLKNLSSLPKDCIKNLVLAYIFLAYLIHQLNISNSPAPKLLPQDRPLNELIDGFVKNAQKFVIKYLQDSSDQILHFSKIIKCLQIPVQNQNVNYQQKLNEVWQLLMHFYTMEFLENKTYKQCLQIEQQLETLLISINPKHSHTSSSISVSQSQKDEYPDSAQSRNKSREINLRKSSSSQNVRKLIKPSMEPPNKNQIFMKREFQKVQDQINFQEQKFESVEKIQKQVVSLENIITQLKKNNQDEKCQRQQKEGEVQELLSQIQELNEKQKKLEKLVEIQTQQQQQIFLNLQHSIQSNKTTTSIVNIDETSKPMDYRRYFIPPHPDDLESTESPSMYWKNGLIVLQPNSEQFISDLTFNKIQRHYQQNDIQASVWNSQFQSVQEYQIVAKTCENQYNRFIQLRAFQDDKQIALEEISFETMANLFGFLEINEIMPPTIVPQTQFNLHHFFKFFLLPFVVFTIQEDGQGKIQIWPKSPGLLHGLDLKIDFLDQTCILILNYIENDLFRIILCEPQSRNTIKIDLELDYSTLDYFIQSYKNVQDTYQTFVLNSLKNITKRKPQENENENEEEFENLIFDENKILKAEFKDKTNFSFENIQFSKSREFLQFIQFVTISIENFIKQNHQINFEQVNFIFKYIKYKSWNNGTKGQIQLVREFKSETSLQIILGNSYETFGPNKQKIFATGEKSISFQKIQTDFGIQYEKLSHEERIAIIANILQQFSLNTFEKVANLQEDQFDFNPIVQATLNYGIHSRLIVFDQDQQNYTPLTVAVIGINKRLLGIKFTLFEIETSQEFGIFLSINPNEWDLRGKETIQKNIKASVENVPYSDYLFTKLCKCKEFLQILFDKILQTNPFQQQNVSLSFMRNRKFYMDRLENYLNFQEIKKLF